MLILRILPMNRIYHTWDKWECYRSGFFEVNPPKGMTDDDCLEVYKNFLLDIPEFVRVMRLIIIEWPNSCEHNLTNERMNRIAWMGQASLAYKFRIPSRYRGGYHLLSDDDKANADQAALEVINEWLALKGYYERHDIESIKSKTEVDLY